MAAGVPVGPARPRPTALPDGEALTAAVLEGVRVLDPPERVALAAWLAAFQHHWPAAFDTTFGADGRALLDELRARVDDPNRFLKLRRIAIDNLSTAL